MLPVGCSMLHLPVIDRSRFNVYPRKRSGQSNGGRERGRADVICFVQSTEEVSKWVYRGLVERNLSCLKWQAWGGALRHSIAGLGVRYEWGL